MSDDVEINVNVTVGPEPEDERRRTSGLYEGRWLLWTGDDDNAGASWSILHSIWATNYASMQGGEYKTGQWSGNDLVSMPHPAASGWYPGQWLDENQFDGFRFKFQERHSDKWQMAGVNLEIRERGREKVLRTFWWGGDGKTAWIENGYHLFKWDGYRGI